MLISTFPQQKGDVWESVFRQQRCNVHRALETQVSAALRSIASLFGRVAGGALGVDL